VSEYHSIVVTIVPASPEGIRYHELPSYVPGRIGQGAEAQRRVVDGENGMKLYVTLVTTVPFRIVVGLVYVRPRVTFSFGFALAEGVRVSCVIVNRGFLPQLLTEEVENTEERKGTIRNRGFMV